jgi:hypothetical protein
MLKEYGGETAWKTSPWWGNRLKNVTLVGKPSGKRHLGGETAWKTSPWWGNRLENVTLVGKPLGKRHLGRQRRRWEDIIKMDLTGAGWKDIFTNTRTSNFRIFICNCYNTVSPWMLLMSTSVFLGKCPSGFKEDFLHNFYGQLKKCGPHSASFLHAGEYSFHRPKQLTRDDIMNAPLSRLPERRVIHNCKTIHVSSAETRLINEQ